MTVLCHDEQRLSEKLGQLTGELRATFAAGCAERLFPAYVKFHEGTGRGDPVALGAALQRLWRDLEGKRMDPDEIAECIETCSALVPDEADGPWVSEQAGAEDAAAAVIFALRCRLSGGVQDAVWAGRRVYEAVDHFVINKENIDSSMHGAEERVLSHPLVQAEILRQHRDLQELLSPATNPLTAARMRARARAESEIVFKLQ